MTEILFYRPGDEYGWMSNFSPHPIMMGGLEWPTTEHYFQAQKFEDEIYADTVMRANSPREAARLGRRRDWPLRSEWESIKDSVMLDALRAKFSQHSGLASLLIATGDWELVEHTEKDSYWADGGDGTGRNMLGRLLMQVREELTRDS